MTVKNYRDLLVWQLGLEVAEEVYRISRGFPKHEVYALASQMQRAAVSISANLAEGHERDSTKDFLRFVAIAQGSRTELETYVFLVQRLSYCEPPELAALLAKLEELGRMLRGLQKSLRAKL